MSGPRSRHPRSIPKQPATQAVPPRPRSPTGLAQYATQLEDELTRLRAAMELQKREFEEETASFPQVLARLAHSERALGQAKTKLIASEEAAVEARAQLNACRARVQEAESQLQQHLDADREARIELSSLRDALGAALEREPEQQRIENELRAELVTLKLALEATEQERDELASLRAALASVHHERDELVGALRGIEHLAQRITRICREPQGATLDTVSRPSQPPEPDDTCATMRPVPVVPTKEAPRNLRRATPEITVDGMPLLR
jgi:chromosome segregation ATPase